MSKSNNNTIDSFKKSIESTVKAIARDANISLIFGQKASPENYNINLPDISEKNYYSDKNIVRGESDSASLIKRFHNVEIHKAMKPDNAESEKIFNKIEFLRCELIGSAQLPGVKKNLLKIDQLNIKNALNKNKHLSKDDTFKLILKSYISNKSLPEEFSTISDPIIKPLTKVLKKKKVNYQKYIDNQKKFSKFALDLIKLVDNETKKSEKEDEVNIDNEDKQNELEEQKQESNEENIKQFTTDSIDQFEVDKQFDSSHTSDNADDNQQGSETEISNEYPENFKKELNFTYKIFTNKFDNIILAENLCESEETIQLRKQLDIQTKKLDSTITVLANKLQRKLLSKQTRWWEFDLDDGILDSGKLSRIIISPENSLSYKKEKDTEFKDTVVTLLIDNSGSMRGRPITIAAISTDILVKTLERCGIKVEVLGFTTNTWKGGRARDHWIRENKPENPGRLNELLHIIYKNADSPARRTKKNFGIMLKEGLLKENIDGEALDWAYKRLAVRPEKRKILMVISDGAPVDDSTLSSNKSTYLDSHLKYVIKFIEKKTPVELLAIGIGHDVTRYYSKAVTILDADDLGSVMSKQLIDLF
jgi:cobaltochelatase CobT